MNRPPATQYELDRTETIRNRQKLNENSNLLEWYRQLYRDQLRHYSDPGTLRILEIGSGASPLSRFVPNVITTDILDLDYLDHVFDCHDIREVDALEDSSFDVITLTNVLHHLQSPLKFLHAAAAKLKPGGKIIATEPYFSFVSTPMFKYLHHERVDLSILRPELCESGGPLANANIAMPWLMFVKHPDWVKRLRLQFDFDTGEFRPFSSISYMATGGISRKLPIPGLIYRALFRLDLALSRALPKVFASFFTIILTRK